MSFASPTVKGAPAAAGLAFLTAAFWVLRGYVWPTLSNVEVGPLQALLDPTLFREDFVVREALRFSPRFFYNELIALPCRVGFPLAWSFALWHLAALAALVSAVRSAATALRLEPVAAALLLVWLLVVNVGTLGGVYFYTHAPVPAVWAGAVAAWGGAFACFGAAALLQFLVGFYAGLLALPLLWHAPSRARLLALAPWVAGLALVYVPFTLSGLADTGALSNDAFVEIYAYLRHPHHLVPSTWPWSLWQRTGLFYLGAWYLLHRTSAGRPALERTVLHFALALAALTLAANWLFVEIVPSSLVTKLQPARVTPLVQVVVLALLATRVASFLARRHWLLAAAVAVAPFSLFPGLVLALAGVLSPALLAPSAPRWPLWLLGAATVVAFRPFGGDFDYHAARHAPWLGLWLVACLPAWLATRPATLCTAAAVAVGLALTAASAPDRLPLGLSRRFAPNQPPLDAPGRLGARFRAHSTPNAVVLAAPSDEMWSFKLHARRALVVDDKNIAFTAAGLREWRDRFTHILGVPFVPGVDPGAAWRAQPPNQLLAIARHYGATHLVDRFDWHATPPGHLIDREGDWGLWALPPP